MRSTTYAIRRCRHCRCTESKACVIPDLLGNLIPCSWWNREKTVCNNPECVRKEIAADNPGTNYYAVVSVEVRQFGVNAAFTRSVAGKTETYFGLDYLSAVQLTRRAIAAAERESMVSKKHPHSEPALTSRRAVR